MSTLDTTRDGIIAALTPPSLEEQLERAERELACAAMIDSFTRMQSETAMWRRRIARITKQIGDRDAG